MARHKGTVKVYFADKGFGFIANDNGDDDVFVHIKDIGDFAVQTIDQGQRVEYDIIKDRARNKIRAVNVELIY